MKPKDEYTIFNADNFLNKNGFRKLPENGTIREGDIVAYDFNNDNSYDHLGILVNISANDKKNWQVASANGLIEVFKCSTVTHRLGIFATPTFGGEFSWWSDQGYTNPAKFDIYYK